jgi:hypothetical protein
VHVVAGCWRLSEAQILETQPRPAAWIPPLGALPDQDGGAKGRHPRGIPLLLRTGLI